MVDLTLKPLRSCIITVAALGIGKMVVKNFLVKKSITKNFDQTGMIQTCLGLVLKMYEK